MERRPIEFRRIVDGVLYDSATLDILHYWDDWSTRFVLARTPDKQHYCIVSLRGSLFFDDIRVKPRNRATILYRAIQKAAPDEVLETLGVRIAEPHPMIKDLTVNPGNLVIAKPSFLGGEHFFRLHPGQFVLNRVYELFGNYMRTQKVLTQREAINWVIDIGYDYPSLWEAVGVYDYEKIYGD